MELRHLRYFVAVAEELSFGRAASRLSIAQPPLSRQIRALEDEVGVRLLARTNRQVTLTEAGRSFLEGARAVLQQAGRSIDQARRAGRGEDGTFSIGFAPSAEIALMPAMVRAVVRGHREIRLDVRTCSEHDAVRAVQAGTLQAAVVPKAVSAAEREVRVEPLASRRVRVVLPVGHALARRTRLSVKQLADEPIVLFARGVSPALHDAVVTVFQGAGVPLRARHEASHLHTCLALVASGLGVSLLPLAGARHLVVCRSLEAPVPSLDFAMVYREDLSGDALREVLRTSRSALRVAE